MHDGAVGPGDTSEGQPSAVRCAWVGTSALMIEYHDAEWGVPEHEDDRLFELLTLEGAQAGLSWSTVLAKRQRYREVFAGFEPDRVARFSSARIERLLRDAGIIRNRLKVISTVANARAVLEVQREFGSFGSYLWGFVDGESQQNRWRRLSQVPSETATSRRLGRDLKSRGFRFVGPTICYAFMQAAGLVNDHTVDCFRYRQLARRAGVERAEA